MDSSGEAAGCREEIARRAVRLDWAPCLREGGAFSFTHPPCPGAQISSGDFGPPFSLSIILKGTRNKSRPAYQNPQQRCTLMAPLPVRLARYRGLFIVMRIAGRTKNSRMSHEPESASTSSRKITPFGSFRLIYLIAYPPAGLHPAFFWNNATWNQGHF